jgi:hypothetical protein
MTRRSWFPATALLLAVVTAVVGSLPRGSEAGIIASRVSASTDAREEDFERIQSVLERKIVHQRLAEYGVSTEVAMAKVREMSGQEVHKLALLTGKVAAGGEPYSEWSTSGALLFCAIVIVILLIYSYFVKWKQKQAPADSSETESMEKIRPNVR